MCGRLAVDVKDDAEGRTPLLWACLLRNKDTGVKIVQLLLERGADLNQRDNGGNSALLLATAVGNKKIVKHLLRDPQAKKSAARVDVNQKNGKGYTALVTAIQVPHASMEDTSLGEELTRWWLCRTTIRCEPWPTCAAMWRWPSC
jgi:hypothetical protein